MMATPGSAQTAVRRILVYVILFALVVVTAVGLTGLLERAIGFSRELASDQAGLAMALAFTFIAGPLAGVLWWWQRRRLTGAEERGAVTWSLYVTLALTTSLVMSTSALTAAVSEAIGGEWEPEALSTAIVWAAVWVLHWLMHRSSTISPTRLPTLPVVLGAAYGLAIMAFGAVDALAALVAEALSFVEPVLAGTSAWVVPVLQALSGAVIGAAVWWWHWFRERGRDAAGAFAGVVLVIVVGALAVVTLFAVGSILFVVLRVLFDTDPMSQILGALDTATAAALVGGVLWAYHAPVLARRGERTTDASRLVTSAVALIGAASGFGVVINALLATFTSTLVYDDPRTLLLGGLSALAVGLPAWWIAWRPSRAVSAEAAGDTGRRVYLIVIFGASAVVAIVTLLLIGFRVFEYVLDPSGFTGFVERVRAPFGLLAATVVVFAYHFAVWRHDRTLARTVEPEAKPTIGRIVLVAPAADADALSAYVHAQLGVRVSTLRAAETVPAVDPEAMPAIVEELRGISAPAVLVVAAGEGGARVVPLTD